MSQASSASPANPVEMVHIHDSKFRSDTADGGVTFLSSGTLRGKFCQVICKKPLLAGTDVPVTDLKEVFGAQSGSVSYPVFEYVPDFPEKKKGRVVTYDTLFGSKAEFDFGAYKI